MIRLDRHFLWIGKRGDSWLGFSGKFNGIHSRLPFRNHVISTYWDPVTEYVEWTRETETSRGLDLHGENRVFRNDDSDGSEYWTVYSVSGRELLVETDVRVNYRAQVCRVKMVPGRRTVWTKNLRCMMRRCLPYRNKVLGAIDIKQRGQPRTVFEMYRERGWCHWMSDRLKYRLRCPDKRDVLSGRRLGKG